MTKKQPTTPSVSPEKTDTIAPSPDAHNISTTEISQALLGLTISDENYDLRILMALRRIMHFVDTYSRRLAVEHHITGPQLIWKQCIE